LKTEKTSFKKLFYSCGKHLTTTTKKFKISTWIYRISLNVAISFYRKENSRKRISNPLITDIFNFSETEISDEKETNLGILNQIISELNDLNKALMLLYLEEKSYKEISDIIGISETNVATKIGRIKSKIKKEFNQLKSQ